MKNRVLAVFEVPGAAWPEVDQFIRERGGEMLRATRLPDHNRTLVEEQAARWGGRVVWSDADEEQTDA